MFYIGLDTSWGQFKGPRGRLEGYLHGIEARLAALVDVEVVDVG